MQISGTQFIKDTLFFIKDTLSGAIPDPLGSRIDNSNFIMTSYPQREVDYPIITLKMPNFDFSRAGLQTTAMDGTFIVEARVWARDEKEKDSLANDVVYQLSNLQFTTDGSVDSQLNNFTLNSAVEVDEEGNKGIKSRVMEFSYNFYNIN